MRSHFIHTLLLLLCAVVSINAQDDGKIASKPLYRDPVFDGAADPVVVWNSKAKRWWMFYTNRRANAPGLTGVTWVHGSPIGIAESADEGATWKYLADAQITLPDQLNVKDITYWAPDVIRDDKGKWNMFLTIVPGIFTDWNHPRSIVQLTSEDLRKWNYVQTLKLSSEKVIDPAVIRMPDGMWRLWYNDERTGKSINMAESKDLKNWVDKGITVKDKPGEGPKVFRWNNKYWLIVDLWKGLGVYRSDDALNWTAQPENLLATPGKGEDDQVIGQHPDVVANNSRKGRAYLFYFTHPGRREGNTNRQRAEMRRSSIQVVELKLKDGWLTCDRDGPTHIKLAAN